MIAMVHLLNVHKSNVCRTSEFVSEEMAVLSQNDDHDEASVLWTVITTVKVTLTSDGPGRKNCNYRIFFHRVRSYAS